MNEETNNEETIYCLTGRSMSIPFLEEHGHILSKEIMEMINNKEVFPGISCLSDVLSNVETSILERRNMDNEEEIEEEIVEDLAISCLLIKLIENGEGEESIIEKDEEMDKSINFLSIMIAVENLIRKGLIEVSKEGKNYLFHDNKCDREYIQTKRRINGEENV